MNEDQEIDRGEFAPVQLDVLCPCCRNAFDPDSDQAICVESFGECIFCRFSPNSKGSKSGTQAELSEIVVKQEVKRRFKNQQPKVIDMKKFVAGPVVVPPEEVDVKHKTKYYALLKEYDRVCYLLDKATDKITDQDQMLAIQTARIVDLQTHIENFDGEDR